MNVQPVLQLISPNELAQPESAAVKSRPVSNINKSPRSTSNVVSSSPGQHTSDAAAAQPVSDGAIAVKSKPVSNINLSPQPTPTVVSSSSRQHTLDATEPVSDGAVAAKTEEPLAQLSSSPPSQLRSSKRSTQRTAKTSHKSSSVSDSLCNIVALPNYIFMVSNFNIKGWLNKVD